MGSLSDISKTLNRNKSIESLVAQTLSQVLAYSEHLEGQTICIPRQQNQKVIYTDYTILMQKL